jgi:hypothetical protein
VTGANVLVPRKGERRKETMPVNGVDEYILEPFGGRFPFAESDRNVIVPSQGDLRIRKRAALEFTRSNLPKVSPQGEKPHHFGI